jgi:hypothetical protein
VGAVALGCPTAQGYQGAVFSFIPQGLLPLLLRLPNSLRGGGLHPFARSELKGSRAQNPGIAMRDQALDGRRWRERRAHPPMLLRN